MLRFQSHSLPSIRSKLYALVLACALPILIGYIAFARDAARREQAHVAEDAQTIAEVMASAVDRDLGNGETAARVMAHSELLARGELERFHGLARRLLRPEFPAHAFALYGPDGTALLHSDHAFGTAPPAAPDPAAIARVVATGEAVTSGLRRASPAHAPTISIAVPVWHEGSVRYVLSVQLHPRRVADLFRGQHLPAGWVAAVFDNQRLLVARSVDLTRQVGQPMPRTVAAALRESGTGIVERSRAGYTAYAHSPRHGWTVTVTFPRDAARTLFGYAPGTTAAGIILLLAITLGFARWLGGGIARSVRELARPAEALGRGEPLVFPPASIRESATVADALRKVEGELLRYRSSLENLVAERTAELERSNAQLEVVYATAPVGLCFMDSDLRIVTINDYLAALNGIPARRHVGRSLPELLGETGRLFERAYRRVLETGRPVIDLEETGETPDRPGETRHWMSSYYPVRGTDRSVVGINAVVLDITERKLQEQRNRDNEEMFRALFESSGDAHFLLAYGAGYVSVNQAMARLFGFDHIDEMLMASPASTSPQYQADGRRSDEASLDYMRRALDEGGVQFEWLHLRTDGSVFHADVLLTSIDIGGKGMMQGTIRDISDRVAAEAALRATGERLAERERFLRTVTDNLPALVGYWDAGYRCQFANRPYLEWLGRTEEEVIGRHATELLEPDQAATVDQYVRGVLAGKVQSFERELRKSTGEVMHAWANLIPDLDGYGGVRGFYMLHADVTDLKQTQDQLVQALREAEQASRAKGEFLANMSHEVRTPMNAIMGLARLLEEGPLDRRERAYVQRMKVASRSLLNILNDLLDVARIEAGRLTLEHTAFQLDDVLQNIAVLTAANAWSKGVEPVFAIAPEVPAALVGDPVRLEQVLLNLIGNAVKFTESGEVVLAVTAARRTPDHAVLAFHVRDTGIGIAPDQQLRMFEPFSQGDSSTSRKYGGAGLGLAIARRLVELMGGTLVVESALGEGADFSFEAAFAVSAEAEGRPAGNEALAVLVADDNDSAGGAVAAACAGFGWQVVRARSGAQALELLAADRHFDLVFVDSELGDMDGAAMLARALAARAGKLPACCLLVPDPDSERLAALADELGIGAILSKPVRPAALRAAIGRMRGAAGGTPEPAPATPLAARLHGMRVLLAEDNLLNQEVASYILVHAGASLEIAANGRIAVDMLLARPDAYDVVLMDLQMPVMDGCAAAEAIRQAGLALPIVAMTANAMEEDRRRAVSAGMQAHLAKPIDVDELISTLERVAGRPPILPQSSAPAVSPGAAAPAGIDLADALPRFGGSLERYGAVLSRFEGSQGDTVEQVRDCLRDADRAGAQQLVHRLRGVAANLGATEAAGRALALEQALDAAADIDGDEIESRLGALDDALKLVFQGARRFACPLACGAPPAPAQAYDLLARLLDLLQNNNMKALAQFEEVGAALPALAGEEVAGELAEAVATLRFDAAAALVRGILMGREKA